MFKPFLCELILNVELVHIYLSIYLSHKFVCLIYDGECKGCGIFLNNLIWQSKKH